MRIRVAVVPNAVRAGAVTAVLCAALLVPAAALAQDTGVIVGVVTDEARQRLPGVTVTVKTAAGVRSVVTDKQGRYRIASLPVGAYRVVADLAGFTLTAREVDLTARYPESDASFVMYVSVEPHAVPGPPLQDRVWPLLPGSR